MVEMDCASCVDEDLVKAKLAEGSIGDGTEIISRSIECRVEYYEFRWIVR